MYSWEIEQLLKLRNYLITMDEYIRIVSSKQVNMVKYDPYNNTFYISTADNYNFQLKIKKN